MSDSTFSAFYQWFKNQRLKNTEEMYCFIMYDIENNKIRRILSKYLEKIGCVRVQKSVFFAQIQRKQFQDLKSIIIDLQQCYENNDSILLLPVGEDLLNRVSCIGKDFDFKLITNTPHTLIF